MFLAISSAEQHTVCFLPLPGRPGLLPSLAGDSVSSRRIVPASSQPDSRPASVCLPVRLLCCPRAAADTRFVPSDTTTRRHHSSLGLRRHLFPLSDDCRPPTHASPPLLQLHLTQTFTSDNTTTIPSNPIHARYSLRLLAARTALCRPRSLALHIASPIHIPASASRIHHPRRAPYSANSARTLDHCLRRRLPTRRHVQLYW